MWVEVTLPSKLRAGAGTDKDVIGNCSIGDIGNVLGEEPEWLNLLVRRQAGDVLEGWVMRSRTKETAEPPRPDIRIAAFLKNCVDAELWINDRPETAPHFVVADYLIALSLIETGLKNAAPLRADSDGIGPFQITSADWALFVADAGKDVFEKNDRDDYMDQCYGAAWLTHKLIKSLSEGLTGGVAGAEPVVPTHVEVFLAYLCGVPAALAFRKAKEDDKGNQRIDQILLQFAQGSEEEKAKSVDALLRRRRDFLKQDADQAETVDGMYARVEKRLGAELKAAFKLMETHTPEDLPAAATEATGEAPWMKIAREEDAFWDAPDVKETTEKGKARVIEYFQSTDFHPNRVEHWCGAFVAHCLAKAGLKDTIVKSAAQAASWKNWGNTPIPLGTKQIPVGAVVVMGKSSDSGPTGHVGFYTRHLPGNLLVELLGGNQSNTVRLSRKAVSKIVAIRWHGDLPETAPVDSGTVTKFAPLLTLISRHEGGTNYNARFGSIKNKNPAFVTMSVKEVLAWQRSFVAKGSPSSAVGRYQIIRSTLLGLVKEMGLTGAEIFNAELQDRMAVQLLKRRELDRFLAGALDLVQFGKLLAQEWASLPVLENTMGHKKPVKRGQSFYSGDGLNAAHIKPKEIEDALSALV